MLHCDRVSAPPTGEPHCGQINVQSFGIDAQAPASAAVITQIMCRSVTGPPACTRPRGTAARHQAGIGQMQSEELARARPSAGIHPAVCPLCWQQTQSARSSLLIEGPRHHERSDYATAQAAEHAALNGRATASWPPGNAIVVSHENVQGNRPDHWPSRMSPLSWPISPRRAESPTVNSSPGPSATHISMALPAAGAGHCRVAELGCPSQQMGCPCRRISFRCRQEACCRAVRCLCSPA